MACTTIRNFSIVKLATPSASNCSIIPFDNSGLLHWRIPIFSQLYVFKKSSSKHTNPGLVCPVQQQEKSGVPDNL